MKSTTRVVEVGRQAGYGKWKKNIYISTNASDFPPPPPYTTY